MSSVNDVTQIPQAFKVKTSHYAIAGLSLVVALSWNDAITTGIKKVYPMPQDQLSAAFLYAIIITLVLILVIWMLPDTKSELPPDTQKKITEVETQERLEQLTQEISKLKQERFRQMKNSEHLSFIREV